MKKLLIILTLISVFACEITREPYNGEEAILASIEKANEKMNKVGDEITGVIEDGKTRMAASDLLELQILYSCPTLVRVMNNGVFAIIGDDLVDARAAWDLAFAEAREVDFSNEYEVNKAIKKLETAWDKLKPMLYFFKLKIKLLFSECLGSIESIKGGEEEEEAQEQIDTVKPEQQELIETGIIIENPVAPPLETEIILEPIETIEIPLEPIETDQEREERWDEEGLGIEERQELLARERRISVARQSDDRYYYYSIDYDESFSKYSDGERAAKGSRSDAYYDMVHFRVEYREELDELDKQGVTVDVTGFYDVGEVFEDALFEIKKEINLRTDFSDRAVIEDTLRRIDELVIRNRFALKRYVDQYR